MQKVFFFSLMIASLTLFFLSGCGQSGRLYLPNNSSTIEGSAKTAT